MATARTTITDEELLQLPKDGNKYEVVDGELQMTPVSFHHERVIVIVRLLSRLELFVTANDLGAVVGSNAMYVLSTGNKRSPDISFVAADRVAVDGLDQLVLCRLTRGSSGLACARR